MNIYEIIRLVVTVGLLVVVWQNAHWSVALVLSLVAVTVEIINQLTRQILENSERTLTLLIDEKQAIEKAREYEINRA